MEIGLQPGIMYNLQKEKQASEIITHPPFEVFCLTAHHNQMYAAASDFKSRLNNLNTLAICIKQEKKKKEMIVYLFAAFVFSLLLVQCD